MAATATNDELTGNFGSWLQDASVAYRGILSGNEAATVTTTGGTASLALERRRCGDLHQQPGHDGPGLYLYRGGRAEPARPHRHRVNPGTSTIKDVAGNTAVVTGAVTNPAGTLKIETTAPTVGPVVRQVPASRPETDARSVGAVVTLTVNFSEAAVVTTTAGTPTLTLNDGGIATYSGGSGTTALAFTYTVAAARIRPT